MAEETPLKNPAPDDVSNLLENANINSALNKLRDYVNTTQLTTPVNNEIAEGKQKASKPTFSTEGNGGVKQMLENPEVFGTDTHAYSRPFTYGAGWRNLNFDRYYQHDGFKQHGFDVHTDNESVYNSTTGLWSDFKRALPQFAKLGYYGIKHSAAPWTSDDDAEDYQRVIAQGQSSRGGVGSFAINLGLNSAYTMGIIAEMAAEEGVLALTTLGTEGAAAPATIPEMGAVVTRGVKSFSQAWKNLNSVRKVFSATDDLNTARKIYESSKKGAAAVAKWVNPLENTAEFTNDLIKGLNGVDKLTDYAKIHKGVGSFVRDLRNVKATLGEANLEGGMAELDQRQKLMDDFYDKNGRLPQTDAEINDIRIRAKQTGLSTNYANIGLIYLSNKLTLDTAFKGVPSMKKLLVESENLGNKIITGGVKEEAKSVSKYSLKGLKEIFKPSTLLKGSLRYSTANLTEGVQEISQDAISTAFKDYYDPKYKDPHAAANPSLTDSFTKGFANQFNKQGWETFASGFLMGGLIQGPQKFLFHNIPNAFYKYKNPEGHKQYKAQRDAYIKSVLDAINDPRTKQKDYINLITDNFINQKRATEAINAPGIVGDTKTHVDVQDESMFDHIYTLLRTGRENFLDEQLQGLGELSDAELSEAFDGEDAGHIRTRISSYSNRLDDLKGRYKKIEEAFPNPFDLNTVDPNKSPAAYSDLKLKKNVFDFYKKQILFSGHTFDRTVSRMSDIHNDLVTSNPIAKANSSDITTLLDPQSMQTEIDSLKTDIQLAKDTKDSKTERFKTKKLLHLKNLLSHINGYRSTLMLRHKAESSAEALSDAKKNFELIPGAKVRTTKGDELTVDYVHPDRMRVRLNNGKLYNFKKLELLESPNDYQFAVNDLVSKSLQDMHKSYKNYLQTIADNVGGNLLDSAVDSSFSKIKDYYALNHDSFVMAKAVNALTDVEGSNNIFDSYVKAKQELERDKAEKVQVGLQSFMGLVESDDLANGLYKEGVFIMPEDFKNLKDNSVIPKIFIDSGSKKELTSSDPKYKKGLDIVNKYLEATKEKPETIIDREGVGKQTARGTIHIVRHGETIEDEKGINSGPTQEHITPEGAKHVAEGAEGNVDASLTKIITSTRQRALDSAEIIAKDKDITVEQNAALDPWNTGNEETGFAGIPDEDWHQLDSWFALNPDKRIYAGDDEALKSKYAGKQLLETFNEFKDRVINALPEIIGQLPDGAAIVTHSNVIQLIKAYQQNGSKNTAEIGALFAENEPTKNGEFMPMERRELDPTFGSPVIEGIGKAGEEKPVRIPQDQALAQIREELSAVNDEDQLEGVVEEIESRIIKGEYSSDGVNDLIEARRRELAETLDFDFIKEGDVLIMQGVKAGDEPKRIVVQKDDNKMKLRRFGEVTGGMVTVHRKDLHRDVKYKYKEGMENQEGPQLGVSAKKIAETNKNKNASFTSDPAELKRLADEARKEGSQKVNDDFMNDLGCK